MITSPPRRKAVGLAAIAAALTLTGCASSNHSPGSSMMGGSSYHYSGLTCSAPKSLSGAVVNVTLADMGMTHMMSGTAPLGSPMMLRATPATASAGQVSIIASNMGWRTHEVVILPLAAGASAGHRGAGSDGKVDETGSLGEASASCTAGTGDGVTAGSVGWTTVTLAPGHYELVCNFPNHYADGMWQELIVT